MKFLLLNIILFACVCCGTKSTEIATTDSLGVDTSHLLLTPEVNASGTTLSDSTGYAGGYRLSSSSSAEQARLSLTFVGNKTFQFSLNFQVADFCSDDVSGSFTIDENNTASYKLSDERTLNFTFNGSTVELSDPNGQFGVGVCLLSGTFIHCDGECEPISWEDFGEEEVAEDSVQ
jgi:hypothetical protein